MSESGVLPAQCSASPELLRVDFGTAQNLESMRAAGFGLFCDLFGPGVTSVRPPALVVLNTWQARPVDAAHGCQGRPAEWSAPLG